MIDIQDYINRLDHLSCSTIKKQKLLLSQVFEHAVLSEILSRNPVRGVQLPPATHNVKMILPYAKDEQERLMAAFTQEKNGKRRFRYGWGAVLILETGLRAGEALALEWCDIDRENRTLKVHKNLVRVNGGNIVQFTTKTDAGSRTIPLNAVAMEAVARLHEQAVHGCPFVFATRTGRHVNYRNLLETMKRACKSAGIEHRGLHALRHSFASNLYARGVEVKIISKLLGHASVDITYNRYIHLFKHDIDDTLRKAVGE
ncbi:MAG: tyrosine-type recombinase/integrase [Christensenellales bacterium]